MGTNCGSHPDPDYTNVCSSRIGETYQIPNFCSVNGFWSSNSAKHTACRNSLGGGTGEWDFDSESGSCWYHGTTNFGGGCCGTKCGTVGGSKAVCKRKAFLADKLGCCFKDLKCYTGLDLAFGSGCFADSNRVRTCDPGYRNMASTGCMDSLSAFCAGDDLSDPNNDYGILVNRWTGTGYTQYPAAGLTTSGIGSPGTVTFEEPKKNLCQTALWRILYSGQTSSCLALPGQGVPTPAGFTWAVDMFDKFFSKYYALGGRLGTAENEIGKNDLNPMIWNICNRYPGICQSGLKNFCSQITASDITRRPDLLPWCGCYMAEGQYAKYTDLYQINKECTPTCNVSGVIPLPSTDGYSTKLCDQSTCVIDDVSIQLVNSRFGSGTNFSQICSRCSSSEGITCNCTITGLTMKIIDRDAATSSLNISQNCGSGSKCYQIITDSDGNPKNIEVPCSSDATYNPYAEIEAKSKQNFDAAIRSRNIKILIIIVIALIAVVVFYLLISPTTPPTKDIIIQPNKAPFKPRSLDGPASLGPISGDQSKSGGFIGNAPAQSGSIGGNTINTPLQSGFLSETPSSSFISASGGSSGFLSMPTSTPSTLGTYMPPSAFSSEAAFSSGFLDSGNLSGSAGDGFLSGSTGGSDGFL